MAKEYDGYTHSGPVASKIWESETWPTAFNAAPQVYCQSTVDKKKSGVRNITSTGADVSAEAVSAFRIMLAESGYESAVTDAYPERDAGQETITSRKSFQSFTFNSTFGAAPKVICGYEGNTAGGKKFSVDNITTTGGDITNEEDGGITHWLAHN